ncbi:sensor domain-containing protein [Mesoterricola sediminis]|uniref:Membrane protein n=1 Tax=Mesoterricola sediminis TaxID=2927980 RepID=A0AA48GU86_9BACT|nr:sensor domain-containing protein [Mesoterricola sediminis]BDU76319.1 membrane protein [Mesoterricola sediminis]
MSEIHPYLHALRQAMAGCDPALVQDALAETEARFRAERDRLAWAEPLLSPADAARRILEGLGDPADRAAQFRTRDQLVAQALARPSALSEDPLPDGPEPAPRPWPGFFGVLVDGRAYTALAYLLLAFFTGLFYFIWTVTGLSLSLGFLVLIIGLPMAAFFLGSLRALGLGEGRLVDALLDVRMPRRPPLLPEGKRLVDRLAGLFRDSYTWKCLVYFLIHLPLSLMTSTFMLIGLVVSFSLLAIPVLHWGFHLPLVVVGCETFSAPVWVVLLLPLGGLLGLIGTLHLGLAFGRLHGALARALLVAR